MTNTMKHLSLLGRMETDGLMLSLATKKRRWYFWSRVHRCRRSSACCTSRA